MSARDRLPGVSVHARVIIAVVALTALALFVSGMIVVLWGRVSTERHIMGHLELSVASLRQLADEADPQTGEPWSSPDALLVAALQRSVLAPEEGALAIVDGQIEWTAQPGVSIRPENDPELVSTVTPLTSLDTVTYGQLSTSDHDWAYAVIPVDLPGQTSTAALVHVVDVDQEMAVLTPIYWAYAIVGAASLALVTVIIWLFVGHLLRPIATVRFTAERVTATDTSQRIPVTGHDDLSALAQTINSMLDRLETSVQGQRQLLDDVGHEIRTPLTIARGHLELMDLDDPAEARATRDLVISEMDRMGGLVDDLLTLARSKQPDLLRPEMTDVVQLTDETLTKATSLGVRQWQLDSVAEVTTWLDPRRISQAWLQLAANAVQYSQPGSVVALGSAVDNGELLLWVRDEGQGIDPADQERIFERHVRGSASTGSGLGLSIVTAIAESHQGRVECESRPGEGSVFTIHLPVRGQP